MKIKLLASLPLIACLAAGSVPALAEDHDDGSPHLLTYFNTYTTDHLGQIFLTGIVNIEKYRKADFEIIEFPFSVSMNVQCDMGKISGATLAASVGQFPLGTTAQINSFDVRGPEMSCVLTGGPANTAVAIQAWLFLH